ncbi:MAG: hypothetical protein AVDCRST_MAG77-5430 [uncultured Chloroflexi bacterium]|uniref:Uncharacterized protein n=1 Tax=uncultured Chloroflexota bacterium TaxID=166587 RepID=A0A6J4K8I7_9CHLR|nr:MAG: hypothetical protein AVDCRST_MAG77-5430 [uncultured Chloroflexota bacterium]
MDSYAAPASAALVQPVLTGFDAVHAVERGAEAERLAVASRRAVAADRRARRRYWSVRDLSRRLWLGRGYELLRELIRAGILPATRSARSWWVDDEDAAGLVAAFEDRAGKVRAFRGLERWLGERCYVTPLTPEAETLTRLTHSGFAWRGMLYLPRAAWTQEVDASGATQLRHRSGAVVEAAEAHDSVMALAA